MPYEIGRGMFWVFEFVIDRCPKPFEGMSQVDEVQTFHANRSYSNESNYF